jgi:hypothetical protein
MRCGLKNPKWPILQRAGNRPTWTSFRRRSRLPVKSRKRRRMKKLFALLQRFSGKPGVEKARAEFGKAQEVEERFHHDFDGVDFTMR